jgi:hypothetical protein
MDNCFSCYSVAMSLVGLIISANGRICEQATPFMLVI